MFKPMYKRSYLAIAVALALPITAQAEVEVSAELKNETAVFVDGGQATSQARTMLDTQDFDTGELMKFENSVKIFFNEELTDETSWHMEWNIIQDAEAINGFKGHKDMTQNDWLRELYVDTAFGEDGDIGVRIGKQQVVWGTADGIKLLDIINPTDFRELNQNTTADARIPIWMINAEANVGNASNIQFIVSEHEENKIAGLSAEGASGHPFVFKGVDTITGPVNGFVNVGPALANVAGSFSASAAGGGFTGGVVLPSALAGFTGLTVDGFSSGSWDITTPGQINPGGGAPDPTFADPTNTPGYAILGNIAQNGIAAGDPNGNNFVTNLLAISGTGFTQTLWAPSAASSAFEFMSSATFATFNTFSTTCAVGPTCFGGFTGINSQYVRDYPDDTDVNTGFRFKSALDNGLNYSLNYFYHYDANPSIDVSWHDAVTGEKLTTVLAASGDFDGDGAPDFADPNGLAPILAVNGAPVDAVQTGTISRDSVLNAAFSPAAGIYATSVLLRGSTGYYGGVDPTGGFGGTALNTSGNASALRFTERLNRVHSIGGSFDYAFETEFAPVVIRGEFLYDQDTNQPVIDKRLLAIGDLEGALVMEDADMFKYVLGVDITVLTNLLVSGQFIQFRNLDFVDEGRTCTTQAANSFDCSKYTGDFSTLSLTNGFNKGWENKEFYSLFFSKPYGIEQQGRWNNITIYEDGGGWWNRLDTEWGVDDNFVVSAELNLYWGDDDTTFGQFDESSSLQLGVKYITD